MDATNFSKRRVERREPYCWDGIQSEAGSLKTNRHSEGYGRRLRVGFRWHAFMRRWLYIVTTTGLAGLSRVFAAIASLPPHDG
jgi:hypothetical protein